MLISSIKQSLYLQVVIAILFGILLGHYFPHFASELKPLGDAFIKLIKMLIAPIIFCTIVTGIANMHNMEKLGRVGVKTLLYFEIVSTLALIIGLAVVHLTDLGVGMNIDISTLDTKSLTAYSESAKQQHISEFVLNIIPNTAVDAFAKGDILQVLFFSLLFAFSLHAMKHTGTEVLTLINKVSHVLFGMIESIMKLAPIGALGAMAFTVGKYGIASLIPLAHFMLYFYLTCLVFIFGVLGTIARYLNINLLALIRYLQDELWIVLGTSSSESVLPRLIHKLENLGCSKSIVGLVIPTGYSFNLDGTSIYLAMSAIFIAHATNTPLNLEQEITLFAVLLLSSKGAAGVTGSGFITLAATLTAVPSIPVAGLALIVGIDRFMSEARALTNLLGNSVATLVIAKWENELDQNRLNSLLK